jgi:hypothetical protein
LVGLAQRSSKPVFSEELTIPIRAGKEIPWEPSIISELTATGRFNEEKVVSLIETKALAFAILTTSLDNRDRYSPAVSTAFKQYYPVELRIGTILLRMPLDTDADSVLLQKTLNQEDAPGH